MFQKLNRKLTYSLLLLVFVFFNIGLVKAEELLNQFQNDPSSKTLALSQQQVIANQSSELEKVSGSQISKPPQYQHSSRKGLLLPGEAEVSTLLPLPEEGLAPPYGANIFAGGYESERSDGLNEDYLIAAGDKLSIWLWGGVNYSDVITVDNQGNIFIPSIGPIYIAGVKASGVNKLVTERIRTVYKSNVKIYVNLLTATPVTVYLAGAIIRPSERGSYRNIQVLRDGKTIHQIDLYDFVRQGVIKSINFKDKDVIFVSEQGSVLNVSGGVKNPFRFEFDKKIITGKELVEYVKPLSKTSHVAVSGSRTGGPFSVYLNLEEFKAYKLMNGDKLHFNDDLHAQVYDIKVAGSYLGPSYFTVSKTVKLHELLNYIKIEPKLALDF